jgi:large subunit ribosomal protein L31
VTRPLFLWTGPSREAETEVKPCTGLRKACAGFSFSRAILKVIPPDKTMKPGIHPAYEEVNVVCACGHTFRSRSAHKGDIRVEICSNCHPFFTGRQKLVDTEGRVERFNKRYQKGREAALAKKKPQPAA